MPSLADRLAPYTFTSEPYRMGAGRRPIVHHFWQLFSPSSEQIACGYGASAEDAEAQCWKAYQEKCHHEPADRGAHQPHGSGLDAEGGVAAVH